MRDVHTMFLRTTGVVPGNGRYTWRTEWVCFYLDGSGEHWTVDIEAEVIAGDSAATNEARVTAALTAALKRRQPTDRVSVTDFQLPTFARGSR